MKKVYSSTLLFLLAFTAVAQTSINEESGSWITPSNENSVWQGPDPCTVCKSNENITVSGTVTHYGDLLFDNNATLTIESDGQVDGKYVGDTLVVMGNLTFKNTAVLNVGQGAVLIVTGNLEANNNLGVEANGSIVVLGDFTADVNTTIDNTIGMLYVGGVFDPGKNLTLTDPEKGVGNFDTLKSEDVALFNYVNEILPVTMPVELLYFKATNGFQGVKVEWASAKEWDFSHYTIERSENGTDFYDIHTEVVNGNSQTTKTYTYADNQPQFGANYYRLKATDIDGTVEYKGLAVAYAGTDGALRLYPNPAKGGAITIQNPGTIEGTWVSIINTAGREVLRVQMPEAKLLLPESTLPAGIYIVKVSNHLEIKQAKLVVQ